MLWIWSVVLTACGLVGVYLAGRRNRWGWALGLATQVLWLAYAVLTAQWGFIASACLFAVIYARNFMAWKPVPAEVAQ